MIVNFGPSVENIQVIFAQPQYLGVVDLRFHMASLLHSGCPQVIQGPSCMYPSGPNSDQHVWPGQSDGSTLISPEPPNALAPRLLSCRWAWSFQITEIHEAVFPVLYLCLGVFGHSQWNFNLVIHDVVCRCVILTLPSSLRRFHFPPEKKFFWNYRTVLQIKMEYPFKAGRHFPLLPFFVVDDEFFSVISNTHCPPGFIQVTSLKLYSHQITSNKIN